MTTSVSKLCYEPPPKTRSPSRKHKTKSFGVITTIIILTTVPYLTLTYNSSLVHRFSSTFWRRLHPELLLGVADALELLSETTHTINRPKINLLTSPMKATLPTVDFTISVDGASKPPAAAHQMLKSPPTPTFLSLKVKIRKSRWPHLNIHPNASSCYIAPFWSFTLTHIIQPASSQVLLPLPHTHCSPHRSHGKSTETRVRSPASTAPHLPLLPSPAERTASLSQSCSRRNCRSTGPRSYKKGYMQIPEPVQPQLRAFTHSGTYAWEDLQHLILLVAKHRNHFI